MGKGIQVSQEVIVTCGGCKTKYNFTKAAKKAEKENQNEIKCPNCLHVVGKR